MAGPMCDWDRDCSRRQTLVFRNSFLAACDCGGFNALDLGLVLKGTL